jgi:hypothetical protein
MTQGGLFAYPVPKRVIAWTTVSLDIPPVTVYHINIDLLGGRIDERMRILKKEKSNEKQIF